MATNMALRNWMYISDIADMPYSLARRFLKKIRSPDQLREIEIRCPHIAGEDAELWKAFIARDIEQWETKIFTPDDPRQWYDVYAKLIEDERQEKEIQEAALREKLEEASKGRRNKAEVSFVNKILPAPRDRPSKFGFYTAWGPLNGNAGTSSTRVRTVTRRNARNGSEIIQALKRESVQKAQNMKPPAKGLNRPLRSAIKAPPKAMVNDQLQAKQLQVDHLRSAGIDVEKHGQSEPEKPHQSDVVKRGQVESAKPQQIEAEKPQPVESEKPQPFESEKRRQEKERKKKALDAQLRQRIPGSFGHRLQPEQLELAISQEVRKGVEERQEMLKDRKSPPPQPRMVTTEKPFDESAPLGRTTRITDHLKNFPELSDDKCGDLPQTPRERYVEQFNLVVRASDPALHPLPPIRKRAAPVSVFMPGKKRKQ